MSDGTSYPPDEPQWTAPLPPVPPSVSPPPPPSTSQWDAPPPPPPSQWDAPPPPPPQADWAAQPPWSAPLPPPAVPPRKRRRTLILALVAVVVAGGLAVGGFTLFGSSSKTFTLNGKKIDKPAQVLAATEKNLTTIVTARHGAENGDTRCYFARPKQPAAGADKNDVDTALRCGPVLFVDGDATRAYLPFTLTAGDNASGKVTVTTSASSDVKDPVAVPDTLALLRPDGKTPPNAGSLAVPKPPAADAKALIASELNAVGTPKQLDNALMISLNTGVRLLSAGIVQRYGHGDDARSAPPGEQLIAFQVSDEPGEADNLAANAYLKLKDGNGTRTVPLADSSDQYVVVAEPPSTTPQLVLTDAGYTQTLSLPAGTPGPKNLTVLTRKNRFDRSTKNADVALTVSDGANSAGLTFHASYIGARLDFWPPLHAKAHPTKTGDGYLVVDLTYTDSADPGKTFGFDPEVVTVRLPNGTVIHARNIAASADKILNVFEVPADFTKGSVVVSGSENSDGFTISVDGPVSFPISIAAG